MTLVKYSITDTYFISLIAVERTGSTCRTAAVPAFLLVSSGASVNGSVDYFQLITPTVY